MKARYPIMAALASTLVTAGCGNSPQAAPHHATRIASAKNTAKPGRAATMSGKLKVIGFWAHHKALPASSLGAYKHSLTYLSPLWYSVTASGSLISHLDPAVQAEDKKLNIPVLALVNDGTGTQSFLMSAATRKAAAQSIDHVIAANHYQGVDLDFEPPHTRVKAELTAFITELRDSLPHSDPIVLDVVPHSGGAYDYAALAPEVTQFQLMTYDQHADGTAPGPVAALNWTMSITSRLIRLGVPSSKIYLGIALYGYRWTAGSTHATTIPYNAITPAIRAKGSWNPRYNEMSATIGSNIYWWENRQGIRQKIAFAKKAHLAGVALWQVGYATPAIYDELVKDIGTQP